MKMKKTLIAALVAVSAAAVVHAESITQAVPNSPAGGSDWNVAETWSNNEAPSSGNTYSITNRLNSPDTPATPQTFAGDSLLLDGPGANLQLRCRNGATDAVTVNLILDGGKVALNKASSPYGLVQGEMSVIGTTTLSCYQNETQIRSMRVDSLVSGGATLLLRSSAGYSQPGDSYIQIGNAANTYSGTWNIDNVRGIFTSAGATGSGSSFVVGSGGYLRVDESFSGNSMSVTNGAEVQVNTNVTYFLTSLTANGSSVATGSYSVAELNTETSSTIFSGDGDIVIDTELAANIPQFIADPIVKTNATYGVDYAALGQTLAGSATNSFGDTMTYEVVGGPAWLVVATNGALSGTPTAPGLAEFTIKATAGIYSAQGTLQITVDPLGNPPAFTSDPVVKDDGVFGEDYALQGQSLTNNASDPDDDDLTFALDGSGWLSVASNGDLSGVPDTYGTNEFTVTVDDGNGNSDSAQLLIYIPLPAPVAPSVDAVHRWDFDEGSGTTAADTGTGTAADGTLNGGTIWTNGTGERASYVMFDGAVGSFVGTGLTYDPDTSFTWTVWVKTAVAANSSIILGNRRDGSGTDTDFDPREFVKITPEQTIFRPQDTAYNAEYDDLTVAAGWTHLAVVKSGTTVTAYVNGVPGTPVTLNDEFTNIMPFFMGGDNNTKGIEFFNGGIDDVRIYDYALSDAEVAYVKDETAIVPVMGTEFSGGDLTITWDGTGFKLQTRPNLAVGGWADYPGNPQSPATVPATNGVEFLRLIKE